MKGNEVYVCRQSGRQSTAVREVAKVSKQPNEEVEYRCSAITTV